MSNKISIPDEIITNKIYLIRNEKVMLDRDLAELYGVETKVLKQAVRRNIKRFPKDFMFEMTKEELTNWRTEFMNNADKKGLRYAPFCFTEQGVTMLSCVLSSDIPISLTRGFAGEQNFKFSESQVQAMIKFIQERQKNKSNNEKVDKK